MKIEVDNYRFQRIIIQDIIRLKDFYSFADFLKEHFSAEFINQVNDHDQVFLKYKVDGIRVTLYFSDFLGTEIYCDRAIETNEIENQKLLLIAERLKRITFPAG